MKKEWIKLFLIASLAFNIAFVSMVIYKKFGTEKSTPYVDTMTIDNIELNAKQKIDLSKIIGSFRATLTSYKSDILEKRIDIIESFGNPEYRVEKIIEDINLLNEIENKLNTGFAMTLIDINSILDSKQWLKFLYSLCRNWFFSGMESGN